MKRLVATVLVALTLVSCQETPKGYVINGEDWQNGWESLS